MRSLPRRIVIATALGCALATSGAITAQAAPSTANNVVAQRQAIRADALRDNIAKIANGQIGTGETGDNCNPYGPCEEWCALFATWVWNQAGIDIPRYAYTGDIYTWGENNGRAHASDTGMQVGDIVLYGPGPEDSLHTGVVVAVGDGTITTTEGNSDNQVEQHGPFDPQHAADAGRPGDIYGWVSAE